MIRVQDVSFVYPAADRPAVQSLEFAVEVGEIFGFLGPSGAGKSTTQKILMGLLRDYNGRVSVLGRDLRQWGSDYYERVGVSFESPNHYLKLTALENLAYFGSLYAGPTRDPNQALDDVGLAADAHKRVGQFSKGMRVRLNLARALLHRPDLLFLDEPTAGLDPGTSRRIRDVIRREQARGATIFLTTHDMMVADDLCDRVSFMVDGRIVLTDAPRPLKLRHGRRTVIVEYVEDGRRLQRDFPLDGLADNAGFIETLRLGTIETIHTQETTLEDVFIQVTGRRLA
jgi:fluoroquinolone transport system ATP-binding protein